MQEKGVKRAEIMKFPLPVLALSVLGMTACAQTQTNQCPEVLPAASPRPFSMRTYYMAFLRRGPAWTAEKTPEATAVSKGHMAHIEALSKSGKLLIAGPFEVGENAPKDVLAGIFIFDVPTLEQARALTAEDPGVKAGRFVIDILPWYGPSGLTYDGHERPQSAP
jgi:uncharacterized protein YciI